MIDIFSNLKNRLYFFVCMVILPCYIFIYISFDHSRESLEKELLKSAESISLYASESQRYLIEISYSFLAALVTAPELQYPDSIICQQFVDKMMSSYVQLTNIGVTNRQGILSCNGAHLTKFTKVSNHKYIREAIDKKQLTYSGIYFNDDFSIIFSSPVYNEKDEVVGASFVEAPFIWWQTLMKNSHLPDNSVTYILDKNNKQIASYPNNIYYDFLPVLGVLWKGQDGVIRVYSKNDIRDSSGNVQMTFLTGVAVGNSLDLVRHNYIMITIGLTILVLVALKISQLFYTKSISIPLGKLSDLALRSGKNEKVYFNNSTGIKEIDSLQDRFAEMVEYKKEVENKMINQSEIDRLTGVSNRETFLKTLAESIVYADESQNALSIVVFDLDHFKEINDTRGHEFGNEILKRISSILVKNYPIAKCISRLDGDEFSFILEGGYAEINEVLILVEDLSNKIREIRTLSGEDILLSASFGVAIYPYDGSNLTELISAADQAMHDAKLCGRDSVRRFDQELKRALIDKIELVKDIRSAIQLKEFYLVYQPIVDKKGKVTKFEALIRWNHPIKGQIPPDQFIHCAEESGQIIEIGEWVIKEAKQGLVQLKEKYGSTLQVSVNVSPLQLSNRQKEMSELLSDFKMPLDEIIFDEGFKNGLMVEITENILMNLDESTRQILLGFREKGIQVALDDFGTGYSSLAYIMNYDIDYLKIDKSFVHKLDNSISSLSLCEAIISMAHKLGIYVIAEGVETKIQAELLLDYGCDFFQGYYFSKPITLEEAMNKKE